MQGNGSVNRSDLEASFELRPPVLVRDFKAPALERLFGSDLRHTIEPELHYRFVGGINNFSSIPRFDTVDVESDTSELELLPHAETLLQALASQAMQQRGGACGH